MGGQVFGKLGRTGSILSVGRTVKEDMELKVEKSISGQRPASEGTRRKGSGSRGGRGPSRRVSGREAGLDLHAWVQRSQVP